MSGVVVDGEEHVGREAAPAVVCAVAALLGVVVGLALLPLGVVASTGGGGLSAGLLVAYALLVPARHDVAAPAGVDPHVVEQGLRQLGRAVAARTGADPLVPEAGVAGTGYRTGTFALHGVLTPGGVVAQLTFTGASLHVTYDGTAGTCTTSEALSHADWSARLLSCLASLPPRRPVPAPLVAVPRPSADLPPHEADATGERVA